MGGPVRAIRALIRGRTLATVGIGVIAVVGTPLAFVSMGAVAQAAEARPSGTATVTVEVKGLPGKVSGNVKLTGPGKKSHRITTTTKLKGLASGAYTVTAQAVTSGGKSYRPSIGVCSASGRCSSLSHGRITLKASLHAIVRVTYAVAKSGSPLIPGAPAVPVVPPGTAIVPPGAPLPPGKSETGGWSASIDVAAGGPQAQSDGVVSYPIPLNFTPKLVYRNETEALEPTPPCLGSPTEPVAEPGYLCVYRGGNFGSKESEDKNAQFIGFQDFLGDTDEGGLIGQLIIFRTDEFVLEGTHNLLAHEAALTAAGSWSVTAK